MKKKLAMFMVAAMTTAMLAGCGSGNTTADSTESTTDTTEAATDTTTQQDGDTTTNFDEEPYAEVWEKFLENPWGMTDNDIPYANCRKLIR